MRVLITNENDEFDVSESIKEYVGQTGEVKSTFISAINKVKLLVVEFDDGYCSCWNWGMCKPVSVVDALKPKRVSVSYEDISIEDAENYSTDALFFKWGVDKIEPLKSVDAAFFIINQHKLVRKIETEITPIQAAKDACKSFIDGNKSGQAGSGASFNSFLFDSDTSTDNDWCVSFVSACRAIVNAFDGVE